MPAFSRSELPELHIFVTIVRRRSFRLAAIELGLTTSALSHAMKRLEERLAVRLLHRTARSVAPTPVGERLAQRLEQGFEEIGEALGEVEAYRENPAGELRINVPKDAARLLIAPALADFAAQAPHVRLSITVDDRPVDIVAEGYDAGVRYDGTVPADMVAMPLTRPLRWVVVASPAYLAARGRPRRPQDLLEHACIGVNIGDGSRFDWELGDGEKMVRLEVPGPIALNETDATIEAAVRGVGLAYILERRALEEVERGRLEIVMPSWASTGPGFSAYYASRRQAHPGLRQLMDLIRRREGLG